MTATITRPISSHNHKPSFGRHVDGCLRCDEIAGVIDVEKVELTEAEAVEEIADNAAERGGKIEGAQDGIVRIAFPTIFQASGWADEFGLDGTFEPAVTTLNEPVVLLVKIAEYIAAG